MGQIGQIHEQMDDQDRLIAQLQVQNARTEEELQEVTTELEAQQRELREVYRRLRQAEERLTLQGRAQGALDTPEALPPPTRTAAIPPAPATPLPQWEDAPIAPVAPSTVPPTVPPPPAVEEGPAMPLGEATAIPPAPAPVPPSTVPPPPTVEEGPAMPLGEATAIPPAPAPPSTVPPPIPPPPTIEVQGPTPQNSQEGEKAAALLEVPVQPGIPAATQPGPQRQSRSRSHSPAVNPAEVRRSPRLATLSPSAAAERTPSPGTVTDPTVPRRSPRIASPAPSPGSLKRSATPVDKGPAKKRRV